MTLFHSTDAYSAIFFAAILLLAGMPTLSDAAEPGLADPLSSNAAVGCALVGPCGDVNGSGTVTSADALAVLKTAVGQQVATTCEVSGTVQPGELPATGQTTPSGPDSDGAVQAGVPRAFVDNGDGTISDNVTGLMWEKKDRSGGVHDRDNLYTWSSGTGVLDGTLVTGFLAALNDGDGFAGHNDWRIPNIVELESLRNFEVNFQQAFEEFDVDCEPGCTVATCSCMQKGGYWSSTVGEPTSAFGEVAFGVAFAFGGTSNLTQTSEHAARAVRGVP